MRKELTFTFGSILIVGVLALGCKTVNVENQAPLPSKIEQANPAQSGWNNFPAVERADFLEQKKFPKNLDVDTEIVKAISELYSQQMPSNISKEAMQANTRFVDTDTFLNKFQEDMGRPFLNDNERKAAAANPEFVFNSEDSDRTKRQIFINKSRISSLTDEIRKNLSPEQITNLGNYDLKIIVEESIVSHALSHLNQSEEKLDFSPVAIATAQGNFMITGIHGLNLQLTNLDNGSSLELTGVAEAMTELNASLISRTSGAFVFSRAYYPTTAAVQELNKKANINDNEFKDYYSGNKSIKDLLIKWGSIKNPLKPSMSSGIDLYFLAASIENGNNPDIIRGLIEQEMGQPLSDK